MCVCAYVHKWPGVVRIHLTNHVLSNIEIRKEGENGGGGGGVGGRKGIEKGNAQLLN